MSATPAPLVELDDERTPVTACLTPTQSVRLELLLAHLREADPAVDENTLVDLIFGRGIDAVEAEIRE